MNLLKNLFSKRTYKTLKILDEKSLANLADSWLKDLAELLYDLEPSCSAFVLRASSPDRKIYTVKTDQGLRWVMVARDSSAIGYSLEFCKSMSFPKEKNFNWDDVKKDVLFGMTRIGTSSFKLDPKLRSTSPMNEEAIFLCLQELYKLAHDTSLCYKTITDFNQNATHDFIQRFREV